MIIAPTLRVVALFWTLCVLLTTQSVENCIPTQSVRNENYRGFKSFFSIHWAL